MGRPFHTLDDLVGHLESHGCICGARTRDILLQEGYYPVVNGYREPFLAGVDPADGHRRYRPGTRFDDIYRSFLFDRRLREAVFRYLTRIEATLRNTCAYRFCERHPGTSDYLRASCYTSRGEYLGDPARHARELEGMLEVLERLSHDAESDKAGVRHYARKQEAMPLWVLAGDLTFGTLRRFYNLLERDVQRAVCDDFALLARHDGAEGAKGGAGEGHPITPAWLSRALRPLVEARNICAHDDRLFNHRFEDGDAGFRDLMRTMDRLLTPEESAERDREIEALADEYLDGLPEIRAIACGKA